MRMNTMITMIAITAALPTHMVLSIPHFSPSDGGIWAVEWSFAGLFISLDGKRSRDCKRIPARASSPSPVSFGCYHSCRSGDRIGNLSITLLPGIDTRDSHCIRIEPFMTGKFSCYDDRKVKMSGFYGTMPQPVKYCQVCNPVS